VNTAVYTPLERLVTFVACHRDEDGQGLAEYALILGLVAMIAIVSLMFFGSQVSDKLTIIGNAV
jgi:Flp pilus assembly pilin Flp